MSKCVYCDGRGHCWLPIKITDWLPTWSGLPLTTVQFEDCECPVCEGMGKTLLPMDSMNLPSRIPAKRLWKQVA